MIYFEGLESVIESIYLDETISNRTNGCNIFVNPENTKYLFKRLVIINSCEYPEENIRTLVDNGCQVISRIYTDVPNVDIRPYILKLNGKVIWNGKKVELFSDFSELLEKDLCHFDINTYELYFPKIYSVAEEIKPIDEYNNLSCLGWAMQQTGINVKSDTVFTDIDLIKTGKFIV